MSGKHIAVSTLDVATVSQWLRDAREAADKTRRVVSVLLDVTEKTVTRWEDPEAPSLPDALQLFRLVSFYRAEKKLLVLMGTWEKFRRAAGGAVGPRSKAEGE